ncbi:Metacaspase-3 [Diplonema papillatum]|nr:Metacaspase-3 [Diplonema papillatum]
MGDDEANKPGKDAPTKGVTDDEDSATELGSTIARSQRSQRSRSGSGRRSRSRSRADRTAADELDDVVPDPNADPVLTGVRGRALCVGINYVGQDGFSLTDSVAAATELADAIVEEGFEGPVRILVDDGNISHIPTKVNIEAAIRWLLDNVRLGDGLILAFAGRVNREDNGSLSLCPADHREVAAIPFSDIIDSAVWKLPRGSRLIFLVDNPGPGSISPAHQMLLPYRLTSPEVDAANGSGVPPGMNAAPAGEILITSRAAQADDAGAASPAVEGALLRGFVATLAQLRGRAKSPMDEAGTLFQKRVECRYPGMLQPLVDGGYKGVDFAAWAEKPLIDLQAELAAFAIDNKKSGPLQNMAIQFFRGRPVEDLGTAAPPALALMLAALHRHVSKAVQDAGGSDDHLSILCEGEYRVDPLSPFLPAVGVGAAKKNEDRPAPGVPQSPPHPHVVQAAIKTPFYIPEEGGTGDYIPQPRPLLTQPPPQVIPWANYVGYISTGGDIMGSPRLMYLREAYELAKHTPECKGFSFRGEYPNPVEKVWIYFKSKWDLHGSGWTSYRKHEGHEVFDPSGGGSDVFDPVQFPAAQPQPRQGPPGAVLSPRRAPKAFVLDPWFRQRLCNFYNYYNPAKLPSVVPTLREFGGQEDELFRTLAKGYGPEPPDTMADPLPAGWKLVESPEGDLYYKHMDGRKQWERPLITIYEPLVQR